MDFDGFSMKWTLCFRVPTVPPIYGTYGTPPRKENLAALPQFALAGSQGGEEKTRAEEARAGHSAVPAASMGVS